MFRKVQLKFFAIIIAILIAIFIGVLSSINIIMNIMTERQTKIVLQQVASNVEYDLKTRSFTFTNPNKHVTPPKKPATLPKTEKPPKTDSPTEKQTQPPTTTATTTAKRTSAKTTTTPPAAVATAAEASQHTVTAAETTTAAKTDGTVATEAVKPTEPPKETAPPTESGGGKPDYPWGGGKPDYPWGGEWENPWGNPWYPWGDWENWGDNNKNDDKNNNNSPDDYKKNKKQSESGIKPTADNSFAPVLEGYTIITLNDAEMKPPSAENEFPDKELREPVPKSIGSIEFFVIMADNEGIYTASANNDSLTAESAQDYIDKIFKNGSAVGTTGNVSYCAEKKSNGTLLVLTDRTTEINLMKKLKRITVIVGIISIIFISAAAYFLSGIIVSPLKETFEKQKQFISDASHELKTPLTVISTNADVLKGEIGDNKWLDYISDQADRMNVLVNDLLNLSQLENSNRDFVTTYFDVSRAVTNAALPFECQAFENRKNFVLNIEDGIYINGSEQHIKQMTGIFIDNALKYSKDGGTVRVSLTKEDNKAVLAVYNTGSGVPEEDVDKLFERFYRSDESRARSTGGYGLGLSIAKSIIDKHKFKVQVENQEGRSICFVVTMQ